MKDLKFNKGDINYARPGLSKKGLDVLSNMDIGKEYSFKELNCSYMTWYSLICNNCIDHLGAAMLPTHKIGTFIIAKNLIDDIQQMINSNSKNQNKQKNNHERHSDYNSSKPIIIGSSNTSRTNGILG